MRTGVRRLKSRLDEVLRQVRTGETIVIADHGRAVGRTVPADQPLAVRLQPMVEAGSLAWCGQELEPVVPAAQALGPHSVAGLLIEERG